MDIYYRKAMGNGSLSTKFRLSNFGGQNKEKKSQTKNVKLDGITESLESKGNNENPAQPSGSEGQALSPFNCDRCYNQKKKCSKTMPRCSACIKAGCKCDYIDRSKKRKRSIGVNSKNFADSVPRREGNNQQETAVVDKVDMVGSNPNSRSVSIPSLLSAEKSQDTSEDSAHRFVSRKMKKASSTRRESNSNECYSIRDKILIRSMKSEDSLCKLSEEYINIKPIEGKLPLYFVECFLKNYSIIFSFLRKECIMESLQKINFNQETFIGVDMYLILSSGALIYDYNNQTDYFGKIFSNKSIYSILDILRFHPSTNEVDNFENIEMLCLLCAYATTSFNEELCWNILGVIDRLIIDSGYYKPTCKDLLRQERIFWSAYNMEKELCLLMEKPSQLPSDEIIKVSTKLTGNLSDAEQMQLKEIELHRLQNYLLELKLTETYTKETLEKISGEIENWRASTSSIMHRVQSNDRDLQAHTSQINIEYYYLLIELDGLSSSQSFQFTLQFLSNSFNLMLCNNSTEENGMPISAWNLIWSGKLFKVIRNNIGSLISLLDVLIETKSSAGLNTGATSEVKEKKVNAVEVQDDSATYDNVSFKLSDFNSNLSLMMNILRHSSSICSRSAPLVSYIQSYSEALRMVAAALVSFVPTTSTIHSCRTARSAILGIYESLR